MSKLNTMATAKFHSHKYMVFSYLKLAALETIILFITQLLYQLQCKIYKD